MATEFAVSRTVRDTAALFDAVSAPAPGDPFVITQPERPYFKEVGAPVGKLRIGLTTDPQMPGEVVPEVEKAIRDVAKKCEEMGHIVEEAALNFNLENALLGFKVSYYSVLLICDMLAFSLKRPIDSDHLEPVLLGSYHEAKKLSAGDLLIAQARMNAVRREIAPFFDKYDLLLSPTTNAPATLLGTLTSEQDISPDDFFSKCLEFCPFTPLFNITGQPAVSIPAGLSEAGLPIGAHFVARFGDEATLIRLASAFEEAMPWRDRKPPVHVSN